MKNLTILLLTCTIAFLISSFYRSNKTKTIEWIRPKIVYPENNPNSEASVKLGSSLFFETLLSRDRSVSCQSCHLITEAFADHLPKGVGIDQREVPRNTPSLLNIGLHPYFMMDGKFSSLEDQVLGPIKDHREFDLSPEEVVERLQEFPLYNRMSQEAYGVPIDITVVQRSLSNFERILTADSSKFDEYMRGNVAALNEKEIAGWNLFNSRKLNCISCHNQYNFTDYSFQNNGTYTNYTDSGRANITHRKEDIGKFKTPSLRNVAITYPYMHDGSFENLEQVIDHYSNGGKKHFNQSEKIKGFSITSIEKEQLIAFLKSLTDKHLLAGLKN